MSSLIDLPEFSEFDKNCTELDLSNRNLTSLDGIEQFQQLQTLYCYGNQLTSLDGRKSDRDETSSRTGGANLPSELKRLYCYDNQLTSLDTLPSGLQELYCDDNQLTSLDGLTSDRGANLPSGLQILYCGGNRLTSLNNLPSGLQELYCYNNQLTSLNNLPSGLQKLYCGGNQLTSLDNLPSGLQELYFYNNQLTSLDNLPSGLQKLYCDRNRLSEEYKDKTLEEIHQINRDKKILKLKRSFQARKIQKVWHKYWYLDLVEGDSSDACVPAHLRCLEVRYIKNLKKKIPLLL